MFWAGIELTTSSKSCLSQLFCHAELWRNENHSTWFPINMQSAVTPSWDFLMSWTTCWTDKWQKDCYCIHCLISRWIQSWRIPLHLISQPAVALSRTARISFTFVTFCDKGLEIIKLCLPVLCFTMYVCRSKENKYPDSQGTWYMNRYMYPWRCRGHN